LAKDAGSGKTGDEIVAAYVARHGTKILVAPPASGFNLIAWTGPAIGVVAATVMIAFMLRRWRRASVEPSLLAVPPASPADDVYLARLRKELEEGR
jgi:cytochrome c-type biogenesis protein CcmH/NrfF